MKVIVTKLTDVSLVQKACEYTMHGKKSSMTLDKIYSCMHSPIRTQLFTIEMIDIYSFVSTHFVRHSQGVTHFVTSNRDDRGGDSEVNRWTPVNHMMLLNAETLINMSRKRLCGSAHIEAQKLMQLIKYEIRNKVDYQLAKYMVPECYFRNGKCPELKCCGYNTGISGSVVF